MAKLFYTLEEAAEKLGKSEDEVQGLIESGQLQEFRDRDRVMLKVDQVDLLASGEEDIDHIPLAESGELDSIQLASDSGTSMGVESPKEQTGISIFDADETEQDDPSAVTHVQGGGIGVDFSTDLTSSGSGLMDLTRESDDTSLGGEALLEDIYADQGDETVDETVAGAAGGDDLFESTPDADVGVGAPAAAMLAEPYDGTWSGILGGAALATLLIMAATTVVVLGAMVTSSPAAPMVDMVRDSYMMVIAAFGGMVVLFMLVPFIFSKVKK